jgi:hypothetical protein
MMGKSLRRRVFRRFAPVTEARLMRPFLAVTGIALGAGLFEMRVVIPQWASVTEAKEVRPAMERSGHVASGTRFWQLVGPAVPPLTIANLYAALGSSGPRRRWWLASSGTIAGVAAATAAYYVPALHNLRDNAENLPDEQVRRLIKQRVGLDYVRLGVLTAAWLAGLKALSADPNE